MVVDDVFNDIYIKRMEKRIREVYEEAERDIEAKMVDFNRKRNIKTKIYYEKVKKGEISQEDYYRWLAGQNFQGKQWKAKKEQIAETLHDANKIAARIVNEEKVNIFAVNANYQAYKLEHDHNINFGFGLYDSATVVNLVKNDPRILPYYTPKKSKGMSWNMTNINRQITQGIIQGESLDKIAKRLAKVTSSKNMNSMLTHARTGMTAAQNAGRQQRLNEAEKMGIKVHKEWLATLDEHTRWQHRELDGQKRKLNEPFKIGAYTIMYPGDPEAHPSMIYNCRCTLTGDLDDYPEEYERYDNLNGKPIKNMTYSEWKSGKKAEANRLPEFTQIGIGMAKSVDEINRVLNSNHLWRLDASGKEKKADLNGCDLQSAKSIAAAYEQVFSKFPQLKGQLDPVDAHPVKMKDNIYAWCYISNGGKVQVNPKWYGNWRDIEKSYERTVISGFHPKGTTAESVVTHEIGHAIDGLLARKGVSGGITASGEYRYASSSLKTTIMKRAAKKDPIIAQTLEIWGNKEGMKSVVYDYVSGYATENNKEWFAECFAEYITSASPRVVASEFGKELEKLMEKLK